MATEQPTEALLHQVVVNQEGQYSLWFTDREIPPGWSGAGKSGTKEECLAYVDEVWTDMTPISLRKEVSDGA